MVLAVDIGNTNVVIGCFDENEIRFVSHFLTISGKSFGGSFSGLPNRTPFAFAAAIPCACRFLCFHVHFVLQRIKSATLNQL